MIKEHKELLFKDLSARLPYGVKFSIETYDEKRHKYKKSIGKLFQLNCNCFWVYEDDFERYIYSEENKPYLFPLSSMTAEQLYELRELFGFEIEFLSGFIELSSRSTLEYLEMIAIIEWFYKNHFDINGLIPMGLAVDCTNLNIY